MRSIVLPADARPGFSGRLETALSIARGFDSHLTVQIDTPLDQFVINDMYGGTLIAAQAMREACEAGVKLGQRLDALLEGQDVPFDIEERTEMRVDALADASLLADLIVADLSLEWLGELLVRTSTPILALPPSSAPARLDRVACVAWDASEASARALRAAAPLLARCDEVHVLSVGAERGDAFPRADAMRYLSRHEVHAELHMLQRSLSVEETLGAYARRLDADFMVMGAYGHSRLREFLVGGVTRYFLTGGDMALFLAH